MVYISQTARRHVLCYILFIVLFTLMACSQSVSATPARYSLSHLATNSFNNWSGYIASSNSRSVYTEANMSFTVPNLIATPGKDTSVSVWVGIGGDEDVASP